MKNMRKKKLMLLIIKMIVQLEARARSKWSKIGMIILKGLFLNQNNKENN